MRGAAVVQQSAFGTRRRRPRASGRDPPFTTTGLGAANQANDPNGLSVTRQKASACLSGCFKYQVATRRRDGRASSSVAHLDQWPTAYVAAAAREPRSRVL